LLQNDSAAIIGSAQGNNDVTDFSPADTAERKETSKDRRCRLDRETDEHLEDCHCRLDREKKRLIMQCNVLEDPIESEETSGDCCCRLDRERKICVRHDEENRDVADQRRWLDRENKRRVRHAQGKSNVADRRRRLDRERKRSARGCTPSSGRHRCDLQKRSVLYIISLRPSVLGYLPIVRGRVINFVTAGFGVAVYSAICY
jgi:hypothetical protein